MRSRPIPGTGVAVSELGMGCAPIGNLYAPVADEAAAAAVDAAWAGGVRYFDTAPHYGLGLSERRLGAALARYPRERFTVSTKVGRLLVPNPAPAGDDLAAGFAVPDDLTRTWDFSRDGVRRSLEESLARLGLDRVDIAYVHDPDEHLDQALREALPALAELREQGVVGAIGAGMNSTAPLRRIAAHADVDVLMVAGRWTLLDRDAAPLLDLCAERHISVVAAAPFNSGLLASDTPSAGGTFDYATAPPDTVERARRLARLCARHGVALPHAALRFPLTHPAVVAVVAGIRTAAEARADTGWMTTPVPDELWREAG